MDSKSRNIVTAPGDLDPQVPAAGSAVKSRVSSSPTTGSPSNAGEVRQASAASNGASSASERGTTLRRKAESKTAIGSDGGKGNEPSEQDAGMKALGDSVSFLRTRLTTQDGYKLTLLKTTALENWSVKVRN